ncbi:hypothetical protein [Solimonas sp. SE-A11]|uniref:hypothetical protein n=1 Tax=Solimonas sp. SE-A11 TaxID=3054954 RepID=UPI00259D2907|nr:hypothetical protein [Solimonas sp. SE-A11]MDM4769053.1 hypothetical protein [Solimonas sp. SE-A11]
MGLAVLLLLLSVAVDMLAMKYGFLHLSGGQVWLVSLVLMSLSLGAIGWAAHKRWDGVLIDRDNRISLSRLQLIVWTLLLLSALQAVGIFNIPACLTGDMRGPVDVRIPSEIWVLLGLGSFTAVAAPTIKQRYRSHSLQHGTLADAIAVHVKTGLRLQTQGSFDGRVYRNATPADARWLNLVMGDYEGAAYIDISKVQHLVLTLLLVLIYALALNQLLDKPLPYREAISQFPEISSGFLSLLGISHAAYLADKSGGQT